MFETTQPGGLIENGGLIHPAWLWLAGAGLLALIPLAWFLRRRGQRVVQWVGSGPPLAALGPHVLPAEVRSRLAAMHPHLDRLGFGFVADCQMLQGSRPMYCRYYAGIDGRVYAELTVTRLGDTPAEAVSVEVLTFVTIFADGVSMQTCDLGEVPHEDRLPGAGGVLYRFRPHPGIDDLYRDHLRAVQARELDLGTPVLRYPPEHIVEVSLRYAECQRLGSSGYDPVRMAGMYQPDPAYFCEIPAARPLTPMPV